MDEHPGPSTGPMGFLRMHKQDDEHTKQRRLRLARCVPFARQYHYGLALGDLLQGKPQAVAICGQHFFGRQQEFLVQANTMTKVEKSAMRSRKAFLIPADDVSSTI